MTDPKKALCLTKEWKYTPHDATDLHSLFRRIRRQIKEAEAAKKPASNVKALPKKGAK